MQRNPRGDMQSPETDIDRWREVLAHRDAESPALLAEAVHRFVAVGLTPAEVRVHLEDGGDALHAAAASGDPDWAMPFGGAHAVALLASEVGALMSHLVSRAAGIRAVAVEALLEDFSAVSVAAELAVSRQKVYQIARGGLGSHHIETTPWRRP
ncbi:hypothetical protein [Brachybacterium subflavum]|uniref:hypothetical protein n=1 Tax=Brachybacterium subflavum TaxID=2585206 RepID=UPI0012661C9C|nr:hypothetical protein [Brachybacterium subflavum]